MPKASKFGHPIVELNEPYDCLTFECRHCRIKITEGISPELIYDKHRDHLESVTVEIEIADTGEVWELHPFQGLAVRQDKGRFS